MPGRRHSPQARDSAVAPRHYRPPRPAGGTERPIKSSAMTTWTGTAVVVCALVMALWCLGVAVRDRALRRGEFIALALVEVVVMVHVVASIARALGPGSPAEPVPFAGYLATIALLIPAAMVLAQWEPTRWGALIAAVACAVDPVLVVRLNQVWHG
jgi:hypothetical protein